jgi:hypothetical protein
MLAKLMINLRHSALRRCVLLWFALAIAVATASPLIKPQSMELLCTSNATMKLLIKSSDGQEATTLHSMQCALCLQAFAPAPEPGATRVRSDLAFTIAQYAPAVITPARAQPPLPARGPPAQA